MLAGQLQLDKTGESVECALILMQDIATKLPEFLKERAGAGQSASVAAK